MSAAGSETTAPKETRIVVAPGSNFLVLALALAATIAGKDDLAQLYAAMTADAPNRKVTYKVLRPDWFVVAADAAGRRVANQGVQHDQKIVRDHDDTGPAGPHHDRVPRRVFRLRDRLHREMASRHGLGRHPQAGHAKEFHWAHGLRLDQAFPRRPARSRVRLLLRL